MNDYPLIFDSWDAKEIASINKVVEKNRFSMGDYVFDFEKKFAKKFGSKYAVCVNSGSSANLLAIAALFFLKKLKIGDEIIVPSVGWSTTYSPLFYLGLKPVFIDIDNRTFNISLKELKRNLTKKTKAIFVVNLLGSSAINDELLNFVKSNNLLLIEDNCESMGAKFKNKFNGTFGLAGTFSFFFSHHITTIEGGMVTTDSKDFYDICKSIRAHGWIRDIDSKSSFYDNNISDFRKMFWFIFPGFNIRPIEFTGALGISQLSKFTKFLNYRKKNYKYFHKKIENHKYIYTQNFSEGSSAFSFPIVLKDIMKHKFNELIFFLKSNRIEIRPIASGNITSHPMIEYFTHKRISSTANAEYIDKYGFMVGNHPIDIKEKIDYLFEKIDLFFYDHSE